jgi:hypothetical protein
MNSANRMSAGGCYSSKEQTTIRRREVQTSKHGSHPANLWRSAGCRLRVTVASITVTYCKGGNHYGCK